MRFCVFPAALMMSIASQAGAQSGPPGTPRGDRAPGEGSPAPGQAAAHEHFERALTWYRAGKYRLAVGELDLALTGDPGGKDLVFNLALVQEKLGDLDGAIQSLERFQSMEKDPGELDRAAQTIERLRGARAELSAIIPHASASAPTAPCAAPLLRGRFDGWVIGGGTLAFASFVAGAVLGVRSLGIDNSRKARDTAVMADFAFATSLLAGAGTAALYFGRFADAAPEHAALPLGMPRASTAGLALHF